MEMGADELISCAFSCGRRLGLNGLASRQFGIGPAFLALSIDLKLTRFLSTLLASKQQLFI